MKNKQLSNHIFYVGVDDKTIDLFEGQYVVPNGISYNSYLLKDEKTVLFDTVDKACSCHPKRSHQNPLWFRQPAQFRQIKYFPFYVVYF